MNILYTTLKLQKTFEEYELCRLQAEQVGRLARKLQDNEVTIAVIGQFKRGKTTLVNSILGKKLLPTGIVPITAAVTRIEYGKESSKVYFKNGLSRETAISELQDYISEQKNRDNEKGVAEVELHTESDFLKDGMILVDTPGVGSVHESNSRSAYDFARESDGVIFMLSVDSPVNQIEIDFLRSVKKYAGKFYFTVNKTDTIGRDDLREYLEYCTSLISDIMGCDEKEVRIIPISAKEETNIDVLADTIRNDLLTQAPEIMKQSVTLKLLDILKNTRVQIRSYREVLNMAPNAFNSRFKEFNGFLDEEREKIHDAASQGRKISRASIYEKEAVLTAKIRELFGIEYFYYVDRESAGEMISPEEYSEEMDSVLNDIKEVLNSIFMYKEENAYTVARRIEDLNTLMHTMEKYERELKRDMD